MPNQTTELNAMTEKESLKKVGVAVLGVPQAVHDVIFYQHLNQPESVDTDIPPAQRASILAGIQNFVETGEVSPEDAAEHDQDLFYLRNIIDKLTLMRFSFEADLIDESDRIGFPLIDFLQNSGIKAYKLPASVKQWVKHHEDVTFPDNYLVLVFDNETDTGYFRHGGLERDE